MNHPLKVVKKASANFTPRQMEMIVKGFANHQRLQILLLLKKHKELAVEGIVQLVDSTTFPTVSSHLAKLFNAGLVSKKSVGRHIVYSLTPLGDNITAFLKMLKSRKYG